MSPLRRRFTRVLLVTCLVAAALVGGFAAAPASVAQPGTVLERVAVTSQRLLPSGPGTGLEVQGDRLVAHRGAGSAPVRVCAPIWFTALGVTWGSTAGSTVRAARRYRRGSCIVRSHLEARCGERPRPRERGVPARLRRQHAAVDRRLPLRTDNARPRPWNVDFGSSGPLHQHVRIRRGAGDRAAERRSVFLSQDLDPEPHLTATVGGQAGSDELPTGCRRRGPCRLRPSHGRNEPLLT